MKTERSPQMLFYNYDLEKIVRANHPLREVGRVVDFRHLAVQFWKVLKKMGRRGYGLDVGIKCLFLQFWYDLSDRELEDRLVDDNGFRWFCEFGLEDKTPDHTYFTRIRTLLGAERIGKILDVAGYVCLTIANRRWTTDCLVGPPQCEALIGQLVLERLDLIIDPLKRKIVPRSESPYVPSLKLK